MTNAQLKRAARDLLETLLNHTEDPSDMLTILGTTISGVARGTSNPVGTAETMIEGLQGWIRLYQSEQRAVSS